MRLWILLAAGFGCIAAAITQQPSDLFSTFIVLLLGLLLLLAAVQTAPKPKYPHRKIQNKKGGEK